ncbi:MAG: hypothetical protein Q9164_005581, partial [Protoblastenia rupestris]
MEAAHPNPPTRHPIFLFTHPRSASNLFMRLFSNHPEISTTAYSFFNAYMHGPEKQYRGHFPDPANPGGIIIDNSNETFQVAFERCQDAITSAMQENKSPLLKEHGFVITQPHIIKETLQLHPDDCPATTPRILDNNNNKQTTTSPPPTTASYTNPTLLPDHLLRSITPIILYRHPAKAIPSMYRALSKANSPPTSKNPDFAILASLAWHVHLIK